jgi:hypothetical protein
MTIDLIPTHYVRWIRRGDQVILQQWYENPLPPPSIDQLRKLAGPWTSGEFRELITPVISEEQ